MFIELVNYYNDAYVIIWNVFKGGVSTAGARSGLNPGIKWDHSRTTPAFVWNDKYEMMVIYILATLGQSLNITGVVPIQWRPHPGHKHSALLTLDSTNSGMGSTFY